MLSYLADMLLIRLVSKSGLKIIINVPAVDMSYLRLLKATSKLKLGDKPSCSSIISRYFSTDFLA